MLREKSFDAAALNTSGIQQSVGARLYQTEKNDGFHKKKTRVKIVIITVSIRFANYVLCFFISFFTSKNWQELKKRKGRKIHSHITRLRYMYRGQLIV